MWQPFKKIAVVGIRKTSEQEFLGLVIIKQLVAANFVVTAISKPGQAVPQLMPEGVAVKEADFTSEEALTAVLEGHDAVVCVCGTMSTGDQIIVIDAAVQAKIRRFFASEYGLYTRGIPRDGKLGQALLPKIEAVDYLIKKHAEHEWFTWSAVANNIFFDWVSCRGGFSTTSQVDWN